MVEGDHGDRGEEGDNGPGDPGGDVDKAIFLKTATRDARPDEGRPSHWGAGGGGRIGVRTDLNDQNPREAASVQNLDGGVGIKAEVPLEDLRVIGDSRSPIDDAGLAC
ncbi:hypothetical protein FRC04_001990 [Tulasnella sp. 424]|nr:hypothetical protein FRC04_001990 [Tulasnella sp. 424]